MLNNQLFLQLGQATLVLDFVAFILFKNLSYFDNY